MKRRLIALFLACLMVFSLFAGLSISSTAAETEEDATRGLTGSQLEEQIKSIYKQALAEARKKDSTIDRQGNFVGYCATYVNWQLVLLGINKSLVAGNGSAEFNNYKNESTSSGGYKITAYPASSYGSLKTILNEITDNGKTDVYNVLIGYKWSEAGGNKGHTTFVHGIVNGTVYASESYSATFGGNKVNEGQPIVCSIKDFCAAYPEKSFTLDGVIVFSKYLAKCTEYPAYLTVKTTKNTTVKSLPCSAATDPDSTDVVTLSSGATFNVTALYKNSAGNYWYKGTTSDGKTGYIYSAHATVTKFLYDDVKISDVSSPSSLAVGQSFSIKGNITSKYNTIESVKGTVTTLLILTQFSETATVNGKSFSLLNSAIDKALKFNELPVGTYTYKITANVKNYYCEDGSTLKNDSKSVELVSASFMVEPHTHSYTATVTEPTCTEKGYTTHTCSCGDSYKDTYVDALGHNYVNGKCTRCGEKEPNSGNTYKLYCHNNYSGKNYLWGTDFDEELLDYIVYSRNTGVATVSSDQTTKHNGHSSLKIVNTSAGTSDGNKDLTISTLTSGRGDKGWIADSKSMTMSFWAKASNANTKLYFRWGFQDGAQSVTLTQDWAYYTLSLNKIVDYDMDLHPWADRAGTVWITEMQLEDGTEATDFVPENVAINHKILEQKEGQKYQLPEDPVREGYIFDGWYTANRGGTKITGDTAVMSGDLIVYAHWTPKAALKVYADPVVAAPGSTVTIPVKITGGAGIAGFTLSGSCSAELTPTNIEKGALLNNAEGSLTVNAPQLAVNWNSSQNIAAEGELLLLTVKVSETAVPDSKLTIKLKLRGDNPANMADINEQRIPVTFEDIIVTVGPVVPADVIPGDVDGSGEVDTIDSIRLAKYLVELVDLTADQKKAADVTGDGDVTTTDAIRLAKYLVGLIESLEK